MLSQKKGRAKISTDPQFTARYVGKVSTFIASGKGCTCRPVQKIWDNSAEENEMRKVTLIVNPHGIILVEKDNTQIDFDIKLISYCSSENPNHERVFSWIYKDSASGQLQCHAVLCSSQQKAQTIAVVMSRAFQIAYKDWKHDRERESRIKSSSRLCKRTKDEIEQLVGERNRKDLSLIKDRSHLSDGLQNNDAAVINGVSEDGSVHAVESLALTGAMAQMNIVEEEVISFSDNAITVND